MCKFCGTRYCAECLRGDYYGPAKEAHHCRKCNQVRERAQEREMCLQLIRICLQMKCQGKRVEVVVFAPGTEPKAPKKSAKGGKGSSKGKASAGKKSKKKKR